MGSKTPPQPGRYEHINDRELLERNADGVMQLKQEWKEHGKTLNALRDEVRLALRPIRREWYEKASLPALTIIAFIFLVVYSTKVSSATVPEPVPHSTASK